MTIDAGGEAAAAAGGEGAAASGALDLLTGGGAAAPAAAAAGDPAAAGEPPTWWNDLSADAPDEKTLSDRAWIENKKYADLPTLIKAARGLESQLGGEKLPMPKGADDKDGWERIYKAIGRPDAPDGYKFDAFEKVNAELTGAFAPVAHGLGLSQAQMEGVVRFNEEMVASEATAKANAHKAEAAELRKEMGAELEAAAERGLRAAERFGLEKTDLETLRNAIGPKKLITMLDNIGKAMGEDTLVGGGRRDLNMTLDKAQQRLAEIKLDKDFQAKLRAGSAAERAEWDSLNATIAAAEDRQRAA